MDKDTRNLIQRATQDARRLLEREYREQLEGLYDVLPDTGEIVDAPGAHLDADGRFTRTRIISAISHERSKVTSDKEAVAAYLREASFTTLNRFAALKLMEARRIVQECVSKGDQSAGFREFSGLAPGLGDLPDRGYRLYLECLFDEASMEVGVLFDRRLPSGLLWPRRPALLDLLEVLNQSGLTAVWAEDETIGWIYQYYNDEAERTKMRKESSAPRNSRELAVRNQFFTPRYVVEFLTDNTLGRIWYEMTHGVTVLKDRCRYLVRRPTEIFMGVGATVPSRPQNEGENLSQEELLRQPVHIPHRPLKDPREIRLLDPACGSMHFGLYAFDLYTVIYDEAWEIAHGPDDAAKSAVTFAPFVAFAAIFSNKAAFLREVPRLIVERNIHGIDIDPRAAQIAGLSLWLRAQRAWHQAGIAPADRPRITRSNLVCAEPMPGDAEQLREFVEQQFPAGERPAFAFLLEKIFDRMTLAGEAGSLLRIEEEIRAAIAEARALAQSQSAPRQTALWAGDERPEQAEFDLRGLSDEQFWQRAEQRIYDALEAYAEQAENGGEFQRRLFADDAAQGFAFIDLCRKRYDVVVMNPPFGDTTESSLAYLSGAYKWRSKNLLCAFVSRGRQLAISGAVGAITDATWLKKADYDDFRRFMLSEDNSLNALSDLGWGVLDGANVASCCFAATCRRSGSSFVTTIRLVDVELDLKGEELLQCIEYSSEAQDGRRYVRDTAFFERFPGQAIAYETPELLVPAFREWLPLEPTYGITRRGYTPGDTFRFFRCWWEVAINDRNGLWWALNNGGAFAPVVGDGLFVALHEEDWRSYRSLSGFRLESEEWIGRAGLGWGKRTDFMYAYPLPEGAMFSNEGHCAFPTKSEYLLPLLAYLNSSVGQSLLNLFCGQHKQAGYVSDLPTPNLDDHRLQAAGVLVSETLERFAEAFSKNETLENFVVPTGRHMEPRKVAQEFADLAAWYEAQLGKIDDLVAQCLPVYSGRTSLHLEQRPKPTFSKNLPQSWFPEVFSFALGTAFGRWDIRYATGERPAPELPDPFAPLPVCPPGMLQGDDGLPLSPEAGRRLRAECRYPLDVAWDGILVDDPEHPLDLVSRAQAALAVLWKDRAEALEHEACELLGVAALRDWFRRPAGFFADHLKRYSKSRRQAPIYWPLSTASGSYTVWIYYHRFHKDTFYRVREMADEKLQHEERKLFTSPQEAGPSASSREAKAIAEQEKFVDELREFRTEVARVAPLWNPNLNDGVLINFAPFHRLIGHPKWRKDVTACWEELAKGDYDWAHLAMHLWPARVIPKCATDRSLAIAHGHDETFWEPDPEKEGKFRPKTVAESEINRLIAERTGPAVKAALESLASQPTSAPARRRARA